MRRGQSLDIVVRSRRDYEKRLVQKKREFEKLERRELEKLRHQLSRSRGPLVVAFIDLCGSTELKRQPQERWLPIVGEFLLDVTRCVSRNKGRVVKYIGDEVLAIFEHPNARKTISQAESFVSDCEATLRKRGKSVAKWALDFGRVVPISVPGGASDFLGTTVDRCARIGKLLAPGTVLVSADFVAASSNRKRWRRIGSVRPKGIEKPFDVFQLDGVGQRIMASDIRARAASSASLTQKASRLDRKLQICREELHRLRGRQ